MQRYRDQGGWLRHPGFWAGATYRFGSWCRRCVPIPARLPLLVLYGLATIPWRVLRSVAIPSRARVGPGLCLVHPHDVRIAPDCRIGKNCLIYHEVTLGSGPVPGVPRVGDDVTIYPGAKVLGGIFIGDAARVGANAVAVRSLPAGALLAAPPVQIIHEARTA